MGASVGRTDYCFNPRTHTGCDMIYYNRHTNSEEVSIHAPTRGATLATRLEDVLEDVSIHAPTRGATCVSPRCVRRLRFNPRTHTGCDAAQYVGYTARVVSIHAPTRGATRTVGANFRRSACFNPRTHTGCDNDDLVHLQVLNVSIHAPTRGATKSHVLFCTKIRVFQSTHPHGVRPDVQTCSAFARCFNPRTHTGCDVQKSTCDFGFTVSIHAPTRGTTTRCVTHGF